MPLQPGTPEGVRFDAHAKIEKSERYALPKDASPKTDKQIPWWKLKFKWPFTRKHEAPTTSPQPPQQDANLNLDTIISTDAGGKIHIDQQRMKALIDHSWKGVQEGMSGDMKNVSDWYTDPGNPRFLKETTEQPSEIKPSTPQRFFTPEEIEHMNDQVRIYLERDSGIKKAIASNPERTNIEELTEKIRAVLPEADIAKTTQFPDYSMYYMVDPKTIQVLADRVLAQEVRASNSQHSEATRILTPNELAYIRLQIRNGVGEKELGEITRILLSEKIHEGNFQHRKGTSTIPHNS